EVERCQQHLHGKWLAAVTRSHPFKALGAFCERAFNPHPRRFTGCAPVRLSLGREAFDRLGQQPCPLTATLHSQRGGIAVDDLERLRVKDQDAIGTGFKESSKPLLTLTQCRFRPFALSNIARYGHV